MADSAKAILAAHGLAPAKQRGQNFLKHRATAEIIIAAAGFAGDDHVIEVGVGLGALTLPLAARVARVTGIEIDRGIVAYLESEKVLPDNVSLIHGDVLRLDFARLPAAPGGRVKLIANLPYAISNPFIFKLIDNRSLLDQCVVLLQAEVADRLTAPPATRPYGIPTVLLGSCARVDSLLTLKAEEFHPKPKVDSRLIRISFDPAAFGAGSFSVFRETVRAAFASRRKTLLNNLSAAPLPIPVSERSKRRALLLEALDGVGLERNCRAETVDVEGFKALAAKLGDLRQNEGSR